MKKKVILYPPDTTTINNIWYGKNSVKHMERNKNKLYFRSIDSKFYGITIKQYKVN